MSDTLDSTTTKWSLNIHSLIQTRWETIAEPEKENSKNISVLQLWISLHKQHDLNNNLSCSGNLADLMHTNKVTMFYSGNQKQDFICSKHLCNPEKFTVKLGMNWKVVEDIFLWWEHGAEQGETFYTTQHSSPLPIFSPSALCFLLPTHKSTLSQKFSVGLLHSTEPPGPA